MQIYRIFRKFINSLLKILTKENYSGKIIVPLRPLIKDLPLDNLRFTIFRKLVTNFLFICQINK